jgi:hypothetical protein
LLAVVDRPLLDLEIESLRRELAAEQKRAPGPVDLRIVTPRALIGEAPDGGWVLTAGDAQLARWQSLSDDAPRAALMVLTACRVWRFSHERSHCSEAAAGSWHEILR